VPESGTAAERLAGIVPAAVVEVLDHLHASGHAGYVVGGSLRDALLGRDPADWDLATNALPDQLVKLFHGAVYENRFGTVAIRRDDDVYDAIAWGREAADGGPKGLVDPFDGVEDLGRRLLRAVGDPAARFREDALRMIRAVRLAAALEFEIEPETLAAIRANAGLVAHLSGERIGAELEKLLATPRPSIGLRLAEETGLLAVIAPDLAAQVGIPQNKVPGDDLWAHTLLTVDAAPANRPVVRLAALVHDIGKPATLSDGHFHHHDVVGARLAEAWLRRLRFPRAAADDVAHLVRHHMFWADPTLSDAAVRRFLKRVGARHLDNLFALRRADDIGSGMSPDDAAQIAFRARLNAELAAEAALDRSALVIDGNDLIRELRLAPRPDARRAGRPRRGRPGAQRARDAPASRTGHACGRG
jgi:putative nucleotidyltransferase with HDIG domain